MQWDASPNAGFAPEGASTWLPVAEDYATRNVAAQSQDPTSMLRFYRALTALRRKESALTVGAYRSVDAGAADVFAFLRSHDDTRFLIALNLGGETQAVDLSAAGESADVVLSTEMTGARAISLARCILRPNEGLIARLRASV
jgi:alpha-glucosidase